MDDPRELSPRRSFAAWSQMVRETAAPWSSADLALARAIGSALADIIVQVHAVRLLVTEHQFRQVRAAVAGAKEPVVIAERGGTITATSQPGAGATFTVRLPLQTAP